MFIAVGRREKQLLADYHCNERTNLQTHLSVITVLSFCDFSGVAKWYLRTCLTEPMNPGAHEAEREREIQIEVGFKNYLETVTIRLT